MINYKRIKSVLILISYGLLCLTSEAHRFPPPESVNELILDITLANTNGENDVIDLGGRTFLITSVNNIGPSGNANGLPVIEPDAAVTSPHSVTIKNGGIEISLLSGIQSRHFEVDAGASLILENVRLKYGFSAGSGGSILNGGNLSLKGVAMLNNQSGIDGGAIVNFNTISVGDSTFAQNRALDVGGAISNFGTVNKLFNSTFFNNSASSNGGAIYNGDTIISMTNNTVVQNTASFFGGGLYVLGPVPVFSANIVAANSTADNAANDIYDQGPPFISNPQYNLVGQAGGGCGNQITTTGHNLVGTATAPLDPGVGSLQYNGGHIWTMTLLPSSPAINAGINPLVLRFDERGPGYLRTSGGATDIGAYELQFCELDSDHDGVCNENDNCPCTFNPDQDDCNHNGIGDACDCCPCPTDEEPCDDTCGPCEPPQRPCPDDDECRHQPWDGEGDTHESVFVCA